MAKSSQYLKVVDQNGNQVEGECFDDEHLKEIDLTGWNWSVEDPAVPKKGAKSKGEEGAKTKGGGGGESDRKPKASKFSFTKTTDKSTTRLLNAMYKGEKFPEAVLTIEEEYEESPLPFKMEILFTDVIVVDFTWRANAESAGLTLDEDWELNYGKIHFKYLWRGTPPGWLDAKFDGPPDSAESSSKKPPPTAAEQRAALERQVDELLKKKGK